MKMKFRLHKRENSAIKGNEGGVQIKLEAVFVKVTKTAYHHGDGSDYSIDNDDSDSETEPVFRGTLAGFLHVWGVVCRIYQIF